MQKKTVWLVGIWMDFFLRRCLVRFYDQNTRFTPIDFIAIWNNKITTSLLGEIMVPPCFALRPGVFNQTPCFPDPVFSTPRDPVLRDPVPRSRVFHLAKFDLPSSYLWARLWVTPLCYFWVTFELLLKLPLSYPRATFELPLSYVYYEV